MRPWRLLAPLLVISLALFVAAAFAPTDYNAILLALLGGLLPASGLIALWLINMTRWRRMGRQLGLVTRETGAFPDLEGRYEGRRLIIMRRANHYGIGPSLTTVVRLEGYPEVRMPGLVADAETVRSILEPLL